MPEISLFRRTGIRALHRALFLAILIIFLSAASASAFTIRVTEFSGCVDPVALGLESCIGGDLTIGLRIEEDPGDEDLTGIAISLHSYGSNQFISGQAVSSYFHIFADPAVGAFGGFTNFASGSLAETSTGGNANRIQLILSGRIAPRPQPTPPPPPGSDPGLDGVIGGGDAMFRITLQLVESATYRIGTSYQGDGLVSSDGSTRFLNDLEIHVNGEAPPVILTPEPTTALLLGLGLAALGALRRV